jgi:predicted peptidase
MGVVWLGANLLALAGIEHYELHQLADEFNVPARVIRAYQPCNLRVSTGDAHVELRYRFRPPGYWTGRHGVPLLVYLHGSGARGFDNVRQLRSVPNVLCDGFLADAFPCAVLAPQCPEELNWSSHIDSDVDMVDAVLRMIDDVLKDTRLDPQRVYLAGFSMGGYGAWALAARAPGRFAAVVPIAGGGDPSWAQQLIDAPVWAVHGAEDQVVPVGQSQSMIAAIREAGGDPRFSELPGVGHGSWQAVFSKDSEILEWVFRQSREPATSSGSVQ